MLRTLITFATLKEADETLKLAQAQKISDFLFACEEGHILITGMGPQATKITLERFIDRAERVINFGIAGALRNDIALHSFHPIMLAAHESSTITFQKEGSRLLTLSAPLHDVTERDRLSQSFDLVDMEGHAIVDLAQQKNKPCLLFKLVSDHCSHTTSKEIRQRLPELSKKLAHYYAQYIKKKE
ncbi:MAG: putative purine nucleoside phosphorylase [Chlamydiia bacterium]|nr:putative purine nucleoside phosphorylase [Chlamydiia bacterium]